MTTKFNNETVPVKLFMWLIAALGIAVFAGTAMTSDLQGLNWKFWVIAVFTVTLSSRIVVNIPTLKSNVSVSDVFLFFIAIMFGFEAAVLLAPVEAYVTSIRFTKQMRFRAFNAGAIAISFFVATRLASEVFGVSPYTSGELLGVESVGALAVLVLTHYLTNTSLMAIANSFRTSDSAWRIWRESYGWMSITCLASGSLALVLALAAQTLSIYAFLLAAPILGVIYFSYVSYHGKLQISIEQATQAQRHLLEMKSSEERFRGAFGRAPIGMGLVSKEGVWLQVNDSLCALLGFPEEELRGNELRPHVHPSDLVTLLAAVGQLLQSQIDSWEKELRFVNRAGEIIWVSASGSSIVDEVNKSPQIILQVQDITRRRGAEEKLRHDAFYDSLTGLPNRALLVEKLSAAIACARLGDGYSFSLVFMDLDRFKVINDSMGHTAGDELLIEVAERLAGACGSSETIARLSGDEFAVLSENLGDEAEKSRLIEKIQRQFAVEFEIRGRSVPVSVSMGLADSGPRCLTPEDILRDADTALHEAKNQGRGRCLAFDQQMHERLLGRLELEADLRCAVENGEMFVVYQPIVSIETSCLSGFEALVRWNHPVKGLINPAQFIGLAEETGDIIGIGEFVLREACRQIREWQDAAGAELGITMSVNVSPKQLALEGLFEMVIDVLQSTGISPDQLKLEITESAIVDNLKNATALLRQLRFLGVQISMDDFGTGYSSLSYLHQLPLTTLKIDRSFVMNMESRKESAEIVHTIILLAKNLGLDVVAEGIEDEAQLRRLRNFECDYAQGYLFSKPLPADEAGQHVMRAVHSGGESGFPVGPATESCRFSPPLIEVRSVEAS